MKNFLTLLIIFCFYTHSISSVTSGFYFAAAFSTEGEEADVDSELSGREQNEADRLSEELNDSCNSDSCKYTFDGEGRVKGDGVGIAYEQISLWTMMLLTAAKMGACVSHSVKWGVPNQVFKKRMKCIGWGESRRDCCSAAVVTGEILQSIMVNNAISDELEKRDEYIEDDGNIDSDVDLKKVLSGEIKIEDITGDLGVLNDYCSKDSDISDEERQEKCHSSSQLRPLRALKRILEKQLFATKMKQVIYITASSALALTVVTDIAAAIKEKSMDAAKMAADLAMCASKGVTGNPACLSVCAAFTTACNSFYLLSEANDKIPLSSCKCRRNLSSK